MIVLNIKAYFTFHLIVLIVFYYKIDELNNMKCIFYYLSRKKLLTSPLFL